MVTPFILSCALKAAIQKDLSSLMGTAGIGPQGKRSLVFAELNAAILSRHLSLCFLDGSTLHSDGSLQSAKKELAYDAEKFHADRADNLSVTDYVTDFPDIARRCHFSLVPKSG